MNIPAHAPLHLLHHAAVGTLATHARQPQGFPYPTVLPFAPDARHLPTILVSRLAEHTRNLHSDPRSGFLIVHAPDGDVLNGERITLVGTFAHVEPTPDVTQRYLRYHPDAERYLVLGDFSFWVMSVERMRYIGGFGAMGWLTAEELDPLTAVSFEEESALIEMIERHPRRPAHVRLLGVDRYGADLAVSGNRNRVIFDAPAPDSESLRAVLEDSIARLDSA
ncbi:pyridoxamine 5'-phosphate oxidase family protein [Paraburkholderia azotifigens]|uniref:Pyridoxamine 5'-phosphate oxidase family protein n=1 Tax=Paraburkholderia azotifigens TaxID=2057004 RepID=A0ABU9QX24_9BURK